MTSNTPAAARRLALTIGRVGVWTFELERLRAADAVTRVREIEALGYPALWIPEGLGSPDVFAHASLLLSTTSRLIVATGIANIHARDAVAMANGGRLLVDAYPGRFVLGMGVSHKPSVARRGGTYGRPVERMAAYLDAMADAPSSSPDRADVPLLLAALGPRMLGLAASRTLGAHPYFVPVEHTASARRVLGPDPLLAVEQAVVLETDPAVARAVARSHMQRYLRSENYTNNLRRLGWSEADLVDEGSDALVDAIVAWGDVDTVVARVHAQLDRGADHVAIQTLSTDGRSQLDQLRMLAPALLDG